MIFDKPTKSHITFIFSEFEGNHFNTLPKNGINTRAAQL